MSSPGSVTLWIGQLQEGKRAVVEKLWERYCPQLLIVARKRLQSLRCRVRDEEDVLIDVFDSVCRRIEQGRFSNLKGRDNLWALLVFITARKVFKLRQYPVGITNCGEELEQVLGREPTPEFAAQVAEECARLLASLTKPDLRAVAQWKMEGYSNVEIARKLGCVTRTVERKLSAIRSIWKQYGPKS